MWKYAIICENMWKYAKVCIVNVYLASLPSVCGGGVRACNQSARSQSLGAVTWWCFGLLGSVWDCLGL